MIKKAIGPLHGPENTTGNNLNIPRGTKTLALPVHLQASFHAFKNAYMQRKRVLLFSYMYSLINPSLHRVNQIHMQKLIQRRLTYLAVISYSTFNSSIIHHIENLAPTKLFGLTKEVDILAFCYPYQQAQTQENPKP